MIKDGKTLDKIKNLKRACLGDLRFILWGGFAMIAAIIFLINAAITIFLYFSPRLRWMLLTYPATNALPLFIFGIKLCVRGLDRERCKTHIQIWLDLLVIAAIFILFGCVFYIGGNISDVFRELFYLPGRLIGPLALLITEIVLIWTGKYPTLVEVLLNALVFMGLFLRAYFGTLMIIM